MKFLIGLLIGWAVFAMWNSKLDAENEADVLRAWGQKEAEMVDCLKHGPKQWADKDGNPTNKVPKFSREELNIICAGSR